MTDTERAIAKVYYRLVYEKKQMNIEEVPDIYKSLLDQYLNEIGYDKNKVDI